MRSKCPWFSSAISQFRFFGPHCPWENTWLLKKGRFSWAEHFPAQPAQRAKRYQPTRPGGPWKKKTLKYHVYRQIMLQLCPFAPAQIIYRYLTWAVWSGGAIFLDNFILTSDQSCPRWYFPWNLEFSRGKVSNLGFRTTLPVEKHVTKKLGLSRSENNHGKTRSFWAPLQLRFPEGSFTRGFYRGQCGLENFKSSYGEVVFIFHVFYRGQCGL